MTDSNINKTGKPTNPANKGKPMPQSVDKADSTGKTVSPLLSPLALMALGLAGAAVAAVPRKPALDESNSAARPASDLIPAEATADLAERVTEELSNSDSDEMTQQLQALVQSMSNEPFAAMGLPATLEAAIDGLTADVSGDVLVAAASPSSLAPVFGQSSDNQILSDTPADVVLAQAPAAATAPAAASAATAATGSAAAAGAAGLSMTAILAGLAGVAVIGSMGSSNNAPGVPADTTAPVIASMGAKIGARFITLTYNEALDASPSKIPPASAFAISTGGVSNPVTDVAISGNVVTLTLTRNIEAGNVSVAYTDPTANNDTNAIQDTAGNDAVTFLQGKLADGYIRGAQIYIDTNKNGVADTSEALAGVVTDADGNFFLPSSAPKGTIIAVGGVNIDTGVPNTIPLKAPEGSTTINPLTTLVQAVVDNSAKPGASLLTASQAATKVAEALGLTLPAGATLTSYDPLSATDTGALEAQQASAQIATMVTLAASGSTSTANAVQSNLATLVSTSVTKGSLVLEDTSTIASVVTVAGSTAPSTDLLTAIGRANTSISAAADLDAISNRQAEALDKVAPATPTLSVAALGNDATPAVKVLFNTTALDGSAVVAGDTVTLYEGTTALSGATTLTADDIVAGFVTINSATLTEGSHTLSAKITDKANNTSATGSAAGTSAIAVIDLTAPTAANLTSSSDDTGAFADDRLTKDNSQTLSITAETGSTVKVYDGEALLGTATEGAQGVFSFTTPSLSDGVHVLSAKATDPAGNTGLAGTSYSVTIDTAAPTATTLSPADGGQSLGLAANLVLTASQTIAKGTGNITLYKADNTLVETFAVSSDKVSVSGSAISINPSLDLVKDQGYYVKVDAGAFTDLAGNAFAGISDATAWNFTAAGATITTALVATNDIINAAELAAGVTVSGTVAAEFTTGSLAVQLVPSTGAAIDLDNVVYTPATGAWTADVPKTLTGTASYTLTTTFTGSGSAAGITGTGQKSIQLDTVAPSAVTTSLATNSGSSSDSITNVGTVNVTGLESSGTWQYSTNSGDSWSAGTGSSIPLTGDGNKTIIVKQTDAAGNVSSTSAPLSFTLDTAAPTASTLSPADGGQSLGLAANLVLTASQTIAKGTGNITLYKADNTVVETFAVSSDKVSINGSAVTINPSADLVKDQGYYVKVDAGAFTDLAGNAFAGISDATAWNFTAAGATITTATVATNDIINAAELAAGVTVSGTVAAEFKTGSLTVQLVPSAGNAIDLANVVYNQETGAWTADVPKTLTGTASYTLTTTFTGSGSATGITGTGQKSIQLDTVAPSAVTTSLATNSGSTSDSITNVGTVNVSGIDSGNTWQYSTNNGGAWTTGTGSSITLTGDEDKSIIVKQTDAAGNVSSTSSPLSFTLDTSVPTATALSPADGGQSLGLAANLVLTASQAIAKGTGNITLYKADNTVVETFAVSSDKVSVSGSTISVNPSSDLIKDQGYYLKVDAGAFTDLAGNAFAGISDATTWNFTAAGATITTATVATNDIINAAELAAGVTVSGTVAAEFTTGSLAVQLVPSTGAAINLVNVVYNQGTGAWTADVPKSLTGTASYTLTTTFTGSGSAAGITGTGQKSIQLDTVAPAAPAPGLNTNSGSTNDSITNVGSIGLANLETGSTRQYSSNGGDWTTFTGISFNVTGDGDKSVIVRQTDLAGNVSSTSEPLSFTFDTAAPAAPGTALATNSGLSNDAITNVGTVNVTDLEGGSSWQYSTDGSSWNAGTGTSFAVTGDGAKSVSVRQTDVAGNQGAASSALTFTLDSTAAAPSMSLATDSGVNTDKTTNVGTVNVSGLEPGASWQYSSDGNTWTPGTGTSFTVTGDGAKSVSVKQTDVTGNTSSASAAFTFTLDTVAAKPTLAYTNSGSADDSITNVGTVTVSGLETGASWQFSLDGTNWSAGTGSSFAVTGDGAKSVSVRQTDLADNSSGASNALAFTLDATAPSVVVTKAPGSYTFNFAFSEAVTGFDASDVAVPQGTTKGTFTAVSSTNYTLVVTPPGSTSDQLFTVNVAAEAAIDVAGNASTAATQLSQSLMVGTAGADTLTSSSALSTFIDLSGGGNDTVKLATASASTAAAPDLIGGFGSGDKIDLSAILKTIGYASLSGGNASSPLIFKNVAIANGVDKSIDQDGSLLVNHVATAEIWSNTSANFPSSKGIKLDFSTNDSVLDYWVVANSGIAVPEAKDAYVASGLAGMTNTSPFLANRLLGTAYFELNANASSFTFALDAMQLSTDATNWIDKLVPLFVSTDSTAKSLTVVTDTDSLIAPTDNQLHMLVKYVTETDTTQLRIQYDSNSATGTTAISEVIALDFSGNVTANLTPAALNFI